MLLINIHRALLREEKMQGVEYPGQKDVNAAMKIHPAMLGDNLTDGCLPCHNGTAHNTQTR